MNNKTFQNNSKCTPHPKSHTDIPNHDSEDYNSEVPVIRELIRKSNYLVGICVTYSNNAEKEKKYWKMACNYFQQAKESFEKLSVNEKKLLSLEEFKFLCENCPSPINISFASNKEENAKVPSQHSLPPPPSQWETIEQLKTKIEMIEKENKKLENYHKTIKNKQFLEALYKEKYELCEKEKHKLNLQLNKCQTELENKESEEHDITVLEKEIKKLKEKIVLNRKQYSSDIEILEKENESIQKENKSLKMFIEEQQSSWSKDCVGQLRQKVNQLEKQIQQYQHICSQIIFILDDTQKSKINEIIQSVFSSEL
jgi:hypothetical protein